MKHLFLIFFLFCSSYASIFFQDDFSRPTESNVRWIAFFNNDQGTLKYENGKANLTNTDYSFSGVAYHTFSSPPAKFTYSGYIQSSNPGAGFYFCFEIAQGKTTGYSLQIGTGHSILIYRYDGDSLLSLGAVSSAFIRSDSNNVSVSKNGNRFTLYCNGFYCGGFNDSLYNSGNIGLMVPPASNASFDNVVMSDTLLDSTLNRCFTDNFSTKVTGWINEGSGEDQVLGGVCTFETWRYQQLFRYVDIRVRNVFAKATTSYRTGKLSGAYGLYIKYDLDTTSSMLLFAINGDRKSAIGSSFDSLKFTQRESIYGSGGDSSKIVPDTLTVMSRGNKTLIFFVNNDSIDSIDLPGTITGVGIFATDSLTISFDDFVIAPLGYSCTPVSSNRIILSQLRQIETNQYDHGSIVNLQGRKTALRGIRSKKIARGRILIR